MERIKKFEQFIREEVSGTEVPVNPNFSYFGAAYGTQKLQNTIQRQDTSVVFSKYADRFFDVDEFDELYNTYLTKSTDKSIPNEFTEQNIDLILKEINP